MSAKAVPYPIRKIEPRDGLRDTHLFVAPECGLDLDPMEVSHDEVTTIKAAKAAKAPPSPAAVHYFGSLSDGAIVPVDAARSFFTVVVDTEVLDAMGIPTEVQTYAATLLQQAPGAALRFSYWRAAKTWSVCFSLGYTLGVVK